MPDGRGAEFLDFGPDSKLWDAALLIVLAFLLGSLVHTIRVPWVEEDTWYGAVYSQAAHNNLRAGILTTAGVPVPFRFGSLPLSRTDYYVHHPTLLPLMITGAFALFGEAEWVARLVPIACSLASVVFLWLLVRDAVGRRAATLSAAIFATLPMELHYGDLVDFEPCLLMWMMGALLCVRYWHTTSRWRWMALTVVCCQFALWTDWPGYLFVLSVAAYFVLKSRSNEANSANLTCAHYFRFALLLLGMVGLSGILFLLQIHYVNPNAWSDLWFALTVRVSNGMAIGSGAQPPSALHFTAGEWCRRITHWLNEDFLPLPWLFAVAGVIHILRRWKMSEGLRWCALAAAPVCTAGVLYVVVLRNESYIHDFATFYLIGALALMAGIGLEGVMMWVERKLETRLLRSVAASALIALLISLAMTGYGRAEYLRSQFPVLDGEVAESPNLVPALGRYLKKTFSADTTILCNFDPYGSTLNYYAQRTIINNVAEAQDWRDVIADERPPLGGIIWLDAPHASEVVAALPKNEVSSITVEGVRFAVWHSTR
jgi:4-amino-4-deoxy-L-arabinose transferase-like glycosyltransferase